MDSIYFQYYDSPFGNLKLGVYQDQLVLCDWTFRKMRKAIDDRISKLSNADFKEEAHPIQTETIRQLEEYFNKDRKEFDLPLLPLGTDFQKTVWNALLQIPFGKTDSYLGFSQKLGNEKAIRAVATANGANAISIIIPCHRIIGSNGELVGYAGGLNAKKKLLTLEGSAPHQNQMSLFQNEE